MTSWPVVLLPLALGCLYSVFRPAATRTESALKALVAFGALAALATEILSLAGLILLWPVAMVWAVICAACLAVRRRSAPSSDFSFRWLETALVVCSLAILLLVATVALLSPPNSWDVLAYHMPRVVYWAQAGSVAFFPVHYYLQITMPPLAEYLVLQTYVLSGGDLFAKMVPWAAFAGCLLAVSLIARALGAGARGQALASLVAATVPSAILQASGTKNECVLALWLCAAQYFALRFARDGGRAKLAWAALALGLAVLTKGTAYIFAPFLLLAALRRKFLVAAPALIAGVLLLNLTHYVRVFRLSGSPLGFSTPLGDDADSQFRWSPDRIGPRTTASTMLRNLSKHMPARSERWNQAVYDAVLTAHAWMGADVNDPASTWAQAQFSPPRNSNHEADVANRWHLLLFSVAGLMLLWKGGESRWHWIALVAAWVAFCAVLRWQPYMTRLELPLFLAAAPLVAIAAERWLPTAAQVALALLLLDQARPFLLENWLRPLRGPRSVLRTPREDLLFSDIAADRGMYRELVRQIRDTGCDRIGVDNSLYALEYPIQALLKDQSPGALFRHVGVSNRSAVYPQRLEFEPCAIVCLRCAGRPVGRHSVVGNSLLVHP